MKRLVYERAATWLIFVAAVLGVGASLLRAGTIDGARSESPNNNDYKGAFVDNSNLLISSFPLSKDERNVDAFERVFAVVDSGGTTEYAVSIGGCGNSLDKLYELRIGFGKGEGFVPASEVVRELSFDAPDFDPEPASIPFGGPWLKPFFTPVSRSDDLLLWRGHYEICGNGCWTEIHYCYDNAFHISIDVPDLPDSVMEFYLPGDLPEGFPPGAKALTIKGTFVEGELPAPEFRRGDCNDDGEVDVADPIANLTFQFVGTFDPPCHDALDFDDSGALDVTDPIANLTHQFLGGPPPAPPGKDDCGVDPTEDELTCEGFAACP